MPSSIILGTIFRVFTLSFCPVLRIFPQKHGNERQKNIAGKTENILDTLKGKISRGPNTSPLLHAPSTSKKIFQHILQ